MKTQPSKTLKPCRQKSKLVTPLLVLLILITVIALPFFSRSSAATSRKNALRNGAENAVETKVRSSATNEMDVADALSLKTASMSSAFLLPPFFVAETLTIFQGTAGNCSTPGPAVSTFDLGQTVCATITGAPIGSRIFRRLAIVNPAGLIVAQADVTTDPQTLAFELPTDATSTFDDLVVDNRGTWRVNNISTQRGAVVTTTKFAVQDPAVPVANLTVTKTVDGSDIVSDGATVTFNVLVTNEGPNAATMVELTDDVPANATFVFGGHPTGYTGPTFNCSNPAAGSSTGSSTCTIASLAKGDNATLQFQYTLNTGLPGGTVVLNTASITSEIFESHPLDNTSTAGVKVAGTATGATCTVDCPADIVVTADTTQGGNPGAFVTFGGASVFGDCGTVTNNPASGSFFTVGTHAVTSSTASGPSCTFNVKVVNTPAPTIMCPADKVATAVDGTASFTLAQIGTPAFTASGGGTVVGVRSDNTPAITDEDGNVITPAVEKALTDPFETGVTGITWTVTDADGRTASCTQRVVVQEVPRDVLTISCPANVNVSAGSGCTASGVTLGTPTTNPSDSHIAVVGVRSDGEALNDPYPVGNTQVVWTATDDVNGNVASCTQTVHVTGTDTTPPTLHVPPPLVVSTSSCSVQLDDELFVATAEDSCSSSVTISRTGVPANFTFPTGTTVITYTATDASGNTSTGTQNVTVNESPAVPPVISCPSNITVFLPVNSTATSMAVNFPAPTATDNCGTPTVTTSVASGSIFPVGTTTVTATATDASGNQSTCQFTVTVLYNFSGFFQPVDNLPVLNVVNAGKAIPVKFSLSGNKGLNIFFANSPSSMTINCDGSAPQSEVDETVNAGGSSLNYTALTDQYNYVWKSENSWKNTCRQLVLKLNDGTEHRANFKFK